jgi:serine/threonine-protein kinase BUR1
MEEGEIVEDLSVPAQKWPKTLKVVHKRSFIECSPIEDYRLLEKCGEGTFGEVHMAKNRKTGELVALKRMISHNQQKEGFHITALREIKYLKWLSHPNIISISDIAYSKKQLGGEIDSFYIVFPYMEHDLAGLLGNRQLTFCTAQLKYYMREILKGCAYLHAQKIMHRDIKSANILLDNQGAVALADFGLAQQFCEARKEYTPGVVTRWYRPPELLLGSCVYTEAIDMWGIGCIFGEFFKRTPILNGETDLHQLELICELCGTPNEQVWPGVSQLPLWKSLRLPQVSPAGSLVKDQWTKLSGSRLFGDLMQRLLELNPQRRITSQQALEHEYFSEIPWPSRRSELPHYRSSHEIDVREARGQTAGPSSRKRFHTFADEDSQRGERGEGFQKPSMRPFSQRSERGNHHQPRDYQPHRL